MLCFCRPRNNMDETKAIHRLIPKIFEIGGDAEITAAHKFDHRLQVVFLFSGDANLSILQLALHFESL